MSAADARMSLNDSPLPMPAPISAARLIRVPKTNTSGATETIGALRARVEELESSIAGQLERLAARQKILAAARPHLVAIE